MLRSPPTYPDPQIDFIGQLERFEQVGTGGHSHRAGSDAISPAVTRHPVPWLEAVGPPEGEVSGDRKNKRKEGVLPLSGARLLLLPRGAQDSLPAGLGVVQSSESLLTRWTALCSVTLTL